MSDDSSQGECERGDRGDERGETPVRCGRAREGMGSIREVTSLVWELEFST